MKEFDELSVEAQEQLLARAAQNAMNAAIDIISSEIKARRIIIISALSAAVGYMTKNARQEDLDLLDNVVKKSTEFGASIESEVMN